MRARLRVRDEIDRIGDVAEVEDKARRTDQKGGAANAMNDLHLLMVMWLLGMVTSYALGGFIHFLLLLGSRLCSSGLSRDAGQFRNRG